MYDPQGPDAVELLRQAATGSREALRGEIGSAQWELLLDRVEQQLDDEGEHQ